MKNIKYKCLRCGNCCKGTMDTYESKRIPVYPEEVNKLILLAEKLNLEFKVIEDLVFPDVKNEKILVLTYRILMDESRNCCPFFQENFGCLIQNDKPLSCQAFPLSFKRVDAFNFQIDIDNKCTFVNKYHNFLKDSNLNDLKEIFPEEFANAEKFFQVNKNLQLKITELEYLKKIEIPRKISLEEYNNYLNNWDRKEIKIPISNENEKK